jgi:hypothetical protein
MPRTFRVSASGKTIIVQENSYNALGLPTSLKTGIIRPKEGADMQAIISHLEAGDVRYEFKVEPAANGIYEMDYVGAAVTTPAPVVGAEQLETA